VNRLSQLLSLVFVAVWGGSWIGPAAATPLNLVTGLSRNVAPGEFALLDIAVTNQAPGDVTDFNAFLVSFQLLPQPGATGSLAITAAAQPASNAILTDPGAAFLEADGSLAPGSVNGSSRFAGVTIANTDPDFGDFLGAGATGNLATLTLTATAGSSGTWTLYAITNAIPLSAWQSTTGDVAFGNLPIPGFGSFSSLELGTVTVSPVPEPAALLFPAALGIVVIGAGRRRGGRRLTSAPA
jgi:hypothetical protein